MHLFTKGRFLALLTLSCAVTSSLIAWDDCSLCDSSRLYIGAFGGGASPSSSEISQMGTVFFLEADGGPMAVLGQGKTTGSWAGFGGLQIGYEGPPIYSQGLNWLVAPAVELETYFFSHKKQGDLFNPTDRLEEHDFLDTFHLNMDMLLVNAVFSFDSFSFGGFSPYVGGGIGASRISIRNAESLQVEPPEPGVNHFNSKQNDSSWAFAAQAKVGLRYEISSSLHFFGEYRYIFVDSSNYIFGSTVFPGHAVTTPWNVKIKNIQFNAFAFGLQYDL